MAYSEEAMQSLLKVKGVGKTFVARLIEMGLDSPEVLAASDSEFITTQGAYLTGSSCYKNSPQARAAAENAVAWAKNYCQSKSPEQS